MPIAQQPTTGMDVPIKVLVVDDNPLDAELALMALQRAEMRIEAICATDEPELRAALQAGAPDVILCDFSFPGFDGLAAQRIAREAYPDTPLIFVSGSLSEERAVLALQSGAVDYVLKSNLLRLPAAVQRAYHESRERQRLEASLAVSEARVRRHAERLEALWQVANHPRLQGETLIQAMLQQAAGAIRPGQRFRGVLGRIEAPEVVVVGVGREPDDDDPHANVIELGSRRAIEQTLIPRVSRTEAWDDLEHTAGLPEVISDLGWRSAISTQFDAGPVRYSLTFASAQPTVAPFGQEDFAYLEVLASSFAKQLQLDQLERSLRDEEERSRQHAERLEVLWQIVNNPSLRDDELWLTMLRQAAAAILPGQDFDGRLWRVRGDDMVLMAAADASGFSPRLEVGNAVPTATAVIGKVLAEGGGTRSWDDIRDTPYASELAHALGLRAFILSTFNAGGTTWVLTFASKEPAAKPLGEYERAYVAVLASFFASQVQQRWQFDRIQYQQSHDVLTGLLNRSQFRSQARAAARASGRFAIILVDVNAMRGINETFGHMVGDALLVEVGTALRKRASADELVGRIGGDVFGVFVPNPVSRDFVRARALDFAGAFAKGFSTGDREHKQFIALSASLGIAVSPDDGALLDAVHSHADAALFAAKERGHGSLVFYEAGMEGDLQRRAVLRNELAEALVGDQFVLHFQPHVEIASGTVSGCEALIRWNHPDRGLLLPSHFIPFAEQTGIIVDIDAWVMRQAMAAAKVLARSRPAFRLYFNLSGRQAGDSKVIRTFIEAASAGVPLSNIGVEITETDAMRDVQATREVCRSLRALDIRVAIDDFGTGYSSLSSLKQLPVDIVKIDRAFVSGVLTDRHDQTIAEAIISIAKHFGFESLAEGAEHPQEIAWLQQRGCRYVQGFAICHPLPLADFETWLTGQPT